MMTLRKGGVRIMRSVGGNLNSSMPLIFQCNANFSTKPSPVACGAAADVAADDLLLDVAAASAAKSEMEPTLLQPRVVVYDGVCHLCHRGVKWLIGADKDKRSSSVAFSLKLQSLT